MAAAWAKPTRENERTRAAYCFLSCNPPPKPPVDTGVAVTAAVGVAEGLAGAPERAARTTGGLADFKGSAGAELATAAESAGTLVDTATAVAVAGTVPGDSACATLVVEGALAG